jgi:hypothetical protein
MIKEIKSQFLLIIYVHSFFFSGQAYRNELSSHIELAMGLPQKKKLAMGQIHLVARGGYHWKFLPTI